MTTLLTNIGQAATPRPAGPEADWTVETIDDAAILVEDGGITWIGKGLDASGADHVVDCRGRVVTPGLVDPHTHLVFGGHRADELGLRAQGKTYQEIASAGGGIRSTVRQTKSLSVDQMVEIGRNRLTWAVSSGTTTIEAKSGYGLDWPVEERTLEAYRRLAEEGPVTIVQTLLALHALPEGRDRESFVAEVIDDWVPSVAQHGLAQSVDAFIETGYFTPGDARALAAAARRNGLGLRLHVDQLSPGQGAELAAELGADSADHLEQTTPEGIAALARSTTVPVLLPGSVLGLGLSRYPDARAMVAAGLPVALATDFNPGSSPTFSQTMVMALAVRMMRMTPAEAFVATTRHAAWSLGLTDRACLAPGMRADLAVWDATDYRELACWFGQSLAESVWIAGRPVYRRAGIST